jgi:hypothetical protein
MRSSPASAIMLGRTRQRMTGWGGIFIFLAATGENIGIGKDALIARLVISTSKPLPSAQSRSNKSVEASRAGTGALGLEQLAGAGLAG